MNDEETKKLLEDGARVTQEMRRLNEALKNVIQEQEALVSLQEQMVDTLRTLKDGAEQIRKGCDSFNAEMSQRGIGAPPVQQTGLAPFLEQWEPKKTDLVN